jgi:hypothetical protein
MFVYTSTKTKVISTSVNFDFNDILLNNKK